MITDNTQIGIVVECFDPNASHRVLIARSRETKSYTYFYIPRIPVVDFGDTIQMNIAENKYYIRRGNSKLIFKITPLDFPGTLLMELISERLNL